MQVRVKTSGVAGGRLTRPRVDAEDATALVHYELARFVGLSRARIDRHEPRIHAISFYSPACRARKKMVIYLVVFVCLPTACQLLNRDL